MSRTLLAIGVWLCFIEADAKPSARFSEEPGAGAEAKRRQTDERRSERGERSESIPHAGICEGAPGNGCPYPNAIENCHDIPAPSFRARAIFRSVDAPARGARCGGVHDQLDDAEVSGVCGCGCASIDFQISDRHTDKKKGMTILSDYLYGPDSPPFGAFVFAHGDTLGGLEGYGFGETADRLPTPEELY